MLLTSAPFGADQAFWPGAKTLPQGQFICPEEEKEQGPRGMGHPVGKCGITFEKFQDIKEGDVIEAYLMEQIEV